MPLPAGIVCAVAAFVAVMAQQAGVGNSKLVPGCAGNADGEGVVVGRRYG